MSIDRRFFKLEDQWNLIHLPDRPNGFAVLIIGDKNHYVDESTSLWIQNYERYQLIEALRNKGYTIFYSNLFGPNWGSQKAIQMLNRLYQYVIRTEILNSQIHVLAEGMGGLAALKFMNEMNDKIRSVGMLSPCLDLKKHLEYERTNKLFYKRFVNEFANAYEIDKANIEEYVTKESELEDIQVETPIKIWHATERVTYSMKNHSRKLEKIRKDQGLPISMTLHLFEKRYSISQSLIQFYKKYEKIL